MEKQLKDYLHLYLNVNCKTHDGYEGVLNEVNFNFHGENKPACRLYQINGWYSVVPELIKPILRPLSDMTEEEMLECGNMIYDFSNDPDLNKWQPSDFEIGLAPEQFHWLLSKHFDIFSLIDAGLAIDYTTLITSKN